MVDQTKYICVKLSKNIQCIPMIINNNQIPYSNTWKYDKSKVTLQSTHYEAKETEEIPYFYPSYYFLYAYRHKKYNYEAVLNQAVITFSFHFHKLLTHIFSIFSNFLYLCTYTNIV